MSSIGHEDILHVCWGYCLFGQAIMIWSGEGEVEVRVVVNRDEACAKARIPPSHVCHSFKEESDVNSA